MRSLEADIFVEASSIELLLLDFCFMLLLFLLFLSHLLLRELLFVDYFDLFLFRIKVGLI